MTEDEIRIKLAGPCGYSYDLRDALTELLGDLYAINVALTARLAALEGAKEATGDVLDAEESQAWKGFNGGDDTSDDRETFGFAFRAGWVARGKK